MGRRLLLWWVFFSMMILGIDIWGSAGSHDHVEALFSALIATATATGAAVSMMVLYTNLILHHQRPKSTPPPTSNLSLKAPTNFPKSIPPPSPHHPHHLNPHLPFRRENTPTSPAAPRTAPAANTASKHPRAGRNSSFSTQNWRRPRLARYG